MLTITTCGHSLSSQSCQCLIQMSQAEHVYDEIADNYLSPVKQREVSVTQKFIYKEYCTTCGFVNAKVAC